MQSIRINFCLNLFIFFSFLGNFSGFLMIFHLSYEVLFSLAESLGRPGLLRFVNPRVSRRCVLVISFSKFSRISKSLGMGPKFQGISVTILRPQILDVLEVGRSVPSTLLILLITLFLYSNFPFTLWLQWRYSFCITNFFAFFFKFIWLTSPLFLLLPENI
mgnify:CR=1 FL=1